MPTTEVIRRMNLNYRAAPVTVAADNPSTWDDATRSVEVIGATENPTKVYDWERGIIDEVLLMDGLEISKQMPLLNAHSRYSTASVLGSYRDLQIKDGQLLGRAHFSSAESADDAALKVKEGHITDFSIGYRVIESVWVPAGQKEKIAGRSFTGPVLVTTRARAKELSVVPIGADEFAKARSENKQITIEKEAPKVTPEEKQAFEDKIRADLEKEYQQKSAAEIEQKAAAATDNIREIIALGDAHNMAEDATRFINDNKTSDQFRSFVLEKMAERGNIPVETENNELGLSGKERQQFSFLNIIRALANPGNRAFREAAEFEFECSRAIEDKTRRTAKGCFVPTDVLRHERSAVIPASAIHQRDMSTMSLAGGGAFVADNLATGSFIEALENTMVLKSLGAIFLRDLVGDMTIPKQTGGATAYWIGEGDNVTESQPALGQVALRPNGVGAFTDLTRKFMLQSSIDAEMFVRGDLALRLALAIDLAGLTGAGANGEPLGILNTTGIGAVSLSTAATPTFAETIDIETEVAIDNALIGNLAYTSPAAVAGNMKQTEKASNTAKFVLENNMVNGYRHMMSNQVTAGYLLFGNWRDLVVGEWSGVDVNVDTSTLSASGGVRVVVIQDVDVALRHPQSFAYGTN